MKEQHKQALQEADKQAVMKLLSTSWATNQYCGLQRILLSSEEESNFKKVLTMYICVKCVKKIPLSASVVGLVSFKLGSSLYAAYIYIYTRTSMEVLIMD